VKDGYHFKVGLVGACMFSKKNAEEFIQTMLGPQSNCFLSKMHASKNGVEHTRASEQEAEKMVQNTKKREKRKKKKKRAKQSQQPQGPEVEEEPIAPL